MQTIVTITGPSCSGKSTLERAMEANGFSRFISTTTRPPRFGEIDGQNYYFVASEEFERMLGAGELVEYSLINGHKYGAWAGEFQRLFALNKPVVVVADPDGAARIKAWAKTQGHRCVCVWLDADDDTIGRRFLERFLDDYNAHADGFSKTRVLRSYASRYAMAQVTERAWREEAWAPDALRFYNLRLRNVNVSIADLLSVILQAVKTDNKAVQGESA